MNISITIDVEPDPKTGKYDEMLSGLNSAEKLFNKNQIKPTLFVTCDCIEKHPQLFRKLLKKGWEISLHGYRHIRFDSLSTKEKEQQIEKALRCFKKHLKTTPKGFRAPQFSSEFSLIEILEKKGFKYDSSTVQFPLSQLIFFRSKLKLYWNQMFFKRKIRKGKLSIKEIPASSFILPISAFTLRKLPSPVFKTLLFFSTKLRKDKSLVFLSHSYEFSPERIKFLDKFIEQHKKDKFITLEKLSNQNGR